MDEDNTVVSAHTMYIGTYNSIALIHRIMKIFKDNKVNYFTLVLRTSHIAHCTVSLQYLAVAPFLSVLYPFLYFVKILIN